MADIWNMNAKHDQGFSLVELVVVLGIVAILLAIAVPAMMAPKRAAQDTAAQATLTVALKTEEVFATDDGSYTTDAATLSALEPSLDWSGATDQSIHVVVGALPDEPTSVLVYMKSNAGRWFGLRQVRTGDQSGRYECVGAAAADVDGLADCTGHDW
jgi:prepilin-type N-terminal cleavage/methylation domain-containing protein